VSSFYAGLGRQSAPYTVIGRDRCTCPCDVLAGGVARRCFESMSEEV
jgi:hypothetical protein